MLQHARIHCIPARLQMYFKCNLNFRPQQHSTITLHGARIWCQLCIYITCNMWCTYSEHLEGSKAHRPHLLYVMFHFLCAHTHFDAADGAQITYQSMPNICVYAIYHIEHIVMRGQNTQFPLRRTYIGGKAKVTWRAPHMESSINILRQMYITQ